jgi:hypothetical protein
VIAALPERSLRYLGDDCLMATGMAQNLAIEIKRLIGTLD